MRCNVRRFLTVSFGVVHFYITLIIIFSCVCRLLPCCLSNIFPSESDIYLLNDFGSTISFASYLKTVGFTSYPSLHWFLKLSCVEAEKD